MSIRIRIVTDYNPLSETEIHDFQLLYKKQYESLKREWPSSGGKRLPCGPVAGALPSRRYGFTLWSGNSDPTCLKVKETKCKTEAIL